MHEQSTWAAAIKYITNSSALNPTLVLSVVCIPLSLILAASARPPLAYYFLIFAAAPLAVALFQIIGFSLINPDRLQNDRHVERKLAITNQMGIREGNKTTEILLPPTGRLIDNPATSSGEEA